MGRARRTSKVLDKAQARSAGIKSINPTLDLGSGLTTASFDAAISNAQTLLSEYNQALAAIDDKYNALVAAEKTLGDISERMLAGIAARFGKDSSEYEQAGGVRKSERKRSTRTIAPAPGTP
jgi:hypothetical protein